MVFIQLPSQFSDEEKMLQQKYQKLKRKKKLLIQHKTPKPEKPDITAQTTLKRAESTKQDAKEVVKRLVKSGAIQVAKPVDKERQGQGFKRSKSLARKRIGADKPAGFKPFQPDPEREPTATSDNSNNSFQSRSESSPSFGNASSPMQTGSSPVNSWNAIAASYSRRGEPPKEKQEQRELVTYDDLI